MPMRTAVRLCPHAEIVRPRFSRYREVSQQVMEIFRSVSPLVEPLSLDEAFIDISQRVESGATPAEVGRWIKDRVREETGLTISCGTGDDEIDRQDRVGSRQAGRADDRAAGRGSRVPRAAGDLGAVGRRVRRRRRACATRALRRLASWPSGRFRG